MKKKQKDNKEPKKWYVFDAKAKILGRFSSEISKVMRGKNKPDFTPHVDSGDGVIIINAEKIEVSGAKDRQKTYKTFSGYPGGLKETPYLRMQERFPERILYLAIKGMMPKTKLAASQLSSNLRIFKGEEHNMQAQKPIQVGE